MKPRHLAIIAMAVLLAGTAHAGKTNFKARLGGNQEVPPVETETTGWAQFRFNKEFTVMHVKLTVRDAMGVLGANGAHLHCGEKGVNGPVVATLAGEIPGGVVGRYALRAFMTDANIADDPTCGGSLANLAEAMMDGLVYVNVHSEDFPAGEIRGQVKGNMGKGGDDDDDEDDDDGDD